MKVLVLGRNGQVGGELERLARLRSDSMEWAFAGRQECDLAHAESISSLVRPVQPRVIVNAAAYTAVDRAEAERDLCFAINADAPRALAEEACRLNALLIHYSSDYVFDGSEPSPYVETDPVHPLSVYGASKVAGERAIETSGCRFLILRTSWVYNARGRNFLRTMLRLGAERPELRVVDDQTGSPTSAKAIAGATESLIGREAAGALSPGLYHMTAAGSTTWFGFAQAIFAASGGIQPRIVPISSAEYPTPARRPANSILSNDRFESAFGFRLSSWQVQLTEVLTELKEMNEPR